MTEDSDVCSEEEDSDVCSEARCGGMNTASADCMVDRDAGVCDMTDFL